MINKLWNILTSLRLTVTLLGFGILLVFIGTVAQADEGLYQAQDRYFKHWFVWGITMFGHKIPIGLPGGYFIGTLLLINLTSAHIKRFQLTTKKIGIHLTHLGVILLLLGQLVTDIFSHETQLRFEEGQAKSWSESGMDYELAFLSDVAEDREQVVAIPQLIVADGGEIKHEALPFTLRVENYWRNSEPVFRPPMQQGEPPMTTNGVGRHFDFRQLAVTHKMDDKNVPTVMFELIVSGSSLGKWVSSGWSSDDTMLGGVLDSYSRQMGRDMANTLVARLSERQVAEVAGKKYTFAMRPARAYEPYSLTLLKATHSDYPGTKIPKDFRSRVRINNPSKGEDREVEIYMNSPLRYGGLTFYQYQMTAGELAMSLGKTPSSTLQVVRNPAWLTPYVGCIIVGVGLIVQFMIHLVGFVSRRKAA